MFFLHNTKLYLRFQDIVCSRIAFLIINKYNPKRRVRSCLDCYTLLSSILLTLIENCMKNIEIAYKRGLTLVRLEFDFLILENHFMISQVRILDIRKTTIALMNAP